MSELAYNRFLNRRMLTGEEQQNKEEVITIIEQVLHAKGKECDEKIGRMPEDELLEILAAMRMLRADLKKRRAEREKLLAK
jgi:uncharacterized protein YfbU (UPF0304 family)